VGTRLAKISGTLQETSGEELARQQGLPSAPTSPSGAQAIGASQDVAKMAGTPNQVRATIRETLKERTDVRDVMGEGERGGSRGRFDVERIQQQLQSLTGLGSLDNRVAEAVRTRLTSTAGIGFKNEVDPAAVEQVLKTAGLPSDAKTIESIVASLAKLRDNLTPDNIAATLKSLGISATINDGAAGLAQKLVQSGVFKQASVEDIKARLSKQLEDVKNFKIKDLGTIDTDTGAVTYSNLDFDPDNAAATLGITREQLDNMTLSEAKAMLASYRQRSFADVDELRDLVANPFATQGQKDYARKRLAELGAIGVTSLEEKTDNIQAQMEQGDTVQVGNRQIRVTELTTDPTYRATIATALSSPEELDKLRVSDPKLADWIDANKKALLDVRDQLTAGLGDFAATQKKFTDYIGDTPPDVMDKLSPGWRDAKDTDVAAWSATLPPALKATLDTTDAGQRGVKMAVLQALLPLSTTFVSGLDLASLDSIVDGAGGDVGKAAELAKDWYQSTLEQPDLKENFGLKYVPTDSVEKGLFDDLAKRFLERETGVSQSLADFSKLIDAKLKSAKATDRQEGMAMLKQFSRAKSLMSSQLTQSTMTDLKKRKTKAEQYTKDMENKNKEVQATERRTSLTPKPVSEVLEMLPEQRDHLMEISKSFKGNFSRIGDHLRQLVTGQTPQEFQLWMLSKGKGSSKSVNGNIEIDTPTPTLDDMILYVADKTRGMGSREKHYSSASWGSGRLFSLRDELEAQARQDLATRRKEYSTLEAEREDAQSQYDTLYNSILMGG